MDFQFDEFQDDPKVKSKNKKIRLIDEFHHQDEDPFWEDNLSPESSDNESESQMQRIYQQSKGQNHQHFENLFDESIDDIFFQQKPCQTQNSIKPQTRNSKKIQNQLPNMPQEVIPDLRMIIKNKEKKKQGKNKQSTQQQIPQLQSYPLSPPNYFGPLNTQQYRFPQPMFFPERNSMMPELMSVIQCPQCNQDINQKQYDQHAAVCFQNMQINSSNPSTQRIQTSQQQQRNKEPIRCPNCSIFVFEEQLVLHSEQCRMRKKNNIFKNSIFNQQSQQEINRLNHSVGKQQKWQTEEFNLEEKPCKYCKQSIIQSFIDDHLEECIPYLDFQFVVQLKEPMECCICSIDINHGQDRRVLLCKHQYHHHCIEKWIQKNPICPICIQTIQL